MIAALLLEGKGKSWAEKSLRMGFKILNAEKSAF
jgi:hypothetical protein